MTTTTNLLGVIEDKYSAMIETYGACDDRCNHPVGVCGNVHNKQESCSMNDKICDDCVEKICDSLHGNCTTCLNQIHWHWEKPSVRTMYDCQKLVYTYVVNYIRKYANEITSALSFVDSSGYPMLNVLSLACGVAPDLIAVDRWALGKPINYMGIDPNGLWQTIQTDAKQQIEAGPNRTVLFQQLRASQLFEQQISSPKSYNAVIIQYLISAFDNSERGRYARELFDKIIATVLPYRVQGSRFLIILSDVDSMNDGRPCFNWLITKLEEAGYSGTALARSQHSAGDLGQNRWGVPNTQRSGTFAYSYQQISQYQPAQLIIEVN